MYSKIWYIPLYFNISNIFLVIGGGITSAVTSALIAEQFNVSSNKILLNVWDKARGYGGRMATSRSPKNPQCTLDLGAQFIHARTEHQKDHRFA